MALCPVEIDGKPCLQVLISETKFIDAKSFADSRKNSEKQLRDTVKRMHNAIFGKPARLDRDLWLSRLSLAEVWKRRKVQAGNSELNMSFVVGVKELDGELLYLNLGGDFEGSAQHAPHTLIAGSTGSGKSVLLQNLILDICATNDKSLANIYLIDPKYGVDYQHLEQLPHLVEGIIDDQERAITILEDLVVEMDNRYKKFKETKVNSLKDFNLKVSDERKIPMIFLIHDEFAEWMLVEQYKSAVSSIVQRLGVKARAAGIHLIFAAQRPDANVLPVQLRDNLGNRLILRVESVGTSEISLMEKGAEKLLGKGHLAARLQGETGLIHAQVPFYIKEGIKNKFNSNKILISKVVTKYLLGASSFSLKLSF
jgi:S-DNA-T family DNA segregation ATPase FtsK/SpoIIIE